ncbi:hypothetical protein [Methanobrevibacter sp.]|uniref:hypothetical protein n=1 Tax=Methanobrevibacter sp. TaxID=66852 RepID=UPI0025D83EFE|nr:hypothetical protein [Methanobrevibacter sp.]MBQ2832353.1 hypothetical protein [Methanobrevibacter sp.]
MRGLNGDYFVEPVYGTNLSRTGPIYLITNHPTSEMREIAPDSIICLTEENANAICELINDRNNFKPEYDTTREVKEVMDCLNRYAGRLNHDIVKTVVEEVYSTKREDLHNVE